MRNLKITLQYDGTSYVGWQRQAAGVSIQGLLEEALTPIEGSPVTVIVDHKSPACTLSLHVRDLPVFDYREALRPSTRLGLGEEEEFEEES